MAAASSRSTHTTRRARARSRSADACGATAAGARGPAAAGSSATASRSDVVALLWPRPGSATTVPLGSGAMAVDRTWVSLESPTAPRAGHGSFPCQGLYWAPSGETPKVAMIATHYNVDFSEHYLASYVAERGMGFLGWNTRYRGNEAYFMLEQAVTDIGVGVRWLRDHGVEHVVILGNSGGGSLMAAYQSQAEGDMRADLYISLQAHLGRPEVFTAWLDPSITDELDVLSVDPDLDMFNEQNGPPYAPEFVERY